MAQLRDTVLWMDAEQTFVHKSVIIRIGYTKKVYYNFVTDNKLNSIQSVNLESNPNILFSRKILICSTLLFRYSSKSLNRLIHSQTAVHFSNGF